MREQDADVVLRIPAEFADDWNKGEPAQVEIIYDQSQRDAEQLGQPPAQACSNTTASAAARCAWSRAVCRRRSCEPLVIAERDQSTPQSRSGLMFAMLPYFFVLGAFIGGMALAIDTTAGERERQSLEPLFANPVPRWTDPRRQARRDDRVRGRPRCC